MKMVLPIIAGIGRAGAAVGRGVGAAAGKGAAFARNGAAKLKAWNDARKEAKAASGAPPPDTGAKVVTAAGLGMMGGAMIEKLKGAGNTAMQAAKHFGTKYLVILLLYHIIKVWLYGNTIPPLYFAIISILMAMWVVRSEGYGGKSAVLFIILLFILDYYGMALILDKINLSNLSSWFVASYWPWLFYFAIISKIKNNDFGIWDGVVVVVTVMFIASVAIPGLSESYNIFRGKTSAEKAAAESQAEELRGAQARDSKWDYIMFTWDCFMEGKFGSELSRCRQDKMYPPEEEKKITSLTENLEPMVIEIDEDKLTKTDSAKEFSGFLSFISPRGDKDIELSCDLYDVRSRSGIEVEGEKKIFEKESLLFAERIFCEPKISLEAGSYIYQISARVKDIMTEAKLDSFFIGKSVLNSLEKEYMSELFKESTDTAYIQQRLESLKKEWFPGLEAQLENAYGKVGKVASKSNPDFSKLALSIGEKTLNDIEEGDELILKIAMQNTIKDSRVTDVDELKIILPEGMELGARCLDKFDSKTNEDGTVKISAKKSFLESGSFPSLTYSAVGAQPIISCPIIISDISKLQPNLDTPEHKTFTATIQYDQIVRKNFSRRITKEEAESRLSVTTEEAIERNKALSDKIRTLSGKLAVPSNIAFALATKESGIMHFDGEGNIKTNGADWGVMQINKKEHELEGCFSSSAEKSGACDVSSCKNTNVLESEDCNIEAGMMILKNCYNQGITKYPEGKKYECNGKTYKGWEYALRCYNGWGESEKICSFARNYVEDVMALA